MTSVPVEPSDEELLGRARAGERDAFAALYDRYHALVYRFARAMGGAAPVAEDVTQEVFLILMRDLDRYDAGRAPLPTYLYGIARNLTRQHRRWERRIVWFDVFPADRPDVAAHADPATAMASSQDVTRVRRLVYALSRRYREVLILCDLHELPYAEVAAILNVRVGTVRSRLHRARSLLAERLRRIEACGATQPSRAPGRLTRRWLV